MSVSQNETVPTDADYDEAFEDVLRQAPVEWADDRLKAGMRRHIEQMRRHAEHIVRWRATLNLTYPPPAADFFTHPPAADFVIQGQRRVDFQHVEPLINQDIADRRRWHE